MGKIEGVIIRTDATQLVGGYPLIGQLDYRDDLGGGDGQTQGPNKLYTASQVVRFERPDDLAYGEEKNRSVTFTAKLVPQSARHYGDIIVNFYIRNNTVRFSQRIRAIKNQGVTIKYTFSLAEALSSNEAFDMEIGYQYNWAGYDDTNPNNPEDNSAAVAVIINQGDIVLNYQEINKFQPPLSTEAYIVNEQGLKTGDIVFGPNSKIKIDWDGIKGPKNAEIKKYKIFYTFDNSGFKTDYSNAQTVEVKEPIQGQRAATLNLSDIFNNEYPFDSIRKQKMWYGIQAFGKYTDDVSEINDSITSTLIPYSTRLTANSLPSSPEIMIGNTTITEMVIPSEGTGSVLVKAGSDNDFQHYYVGLKDSGQWRTSPATITLKEPGSYSFVTFDGLEQSAATQLTVTENIKPIAKIINLEVTNQKELSATGKEQNNKKITALQWYCRSNSQEDLLEKSEAFKIGQEIKYEVEEDLNFSYIFDPTSGLKPALGDYYQIGLAVKDAYEWSDITWWDRKYDMYGRIVLDDSFRIHIYNNYLNSLVEEYQGAYENYFKAVDEGIKLETTLPNIPEELPHLYYQLFYSTNEGYSWVPYGSKQLYKTPGNIILFVNTLNIFNNVIFKIQITDLENNPTQIKEVSSNKLYYAAQPQFPPTTILQLNSLEYPDGRNNIRPNYTRDEAFKSTQWLITQPNSVCTLAGMPQNLKYIVKLHYQTTEFILNTGFCGDSNKPLQGDLLFSQIKDSKLYGDSPVGPYDSYLTFTFVDVFDQSIISAQLNFTVDFREPPREPNIKAVGGSKLLDKLGTQFISYNKIDWDVNNYYDSNLFMNYEHFIIIFQESEVSYSGQDIGFYSFILKEYVDKENYKVVKTFKIPTNELRDVSNFYHDNNVKYKAAILPIGNTFNDIKSSYAFFVSATDSLSYNGNSSAETVYVSSNGIYGMNRVLPTLSISNINIENEPETKKGYISINKSNITTAWLNEHSSFFTRQNKYTDNLKYSPYATLKIQFSKDNTFSENASYEIITVNSNFEQIDNFDGIFKIESAELYNVNKIFIRAVLELTTGFKINEGNISTDKQIIYSNIIIYTGASATVYYRENGVGFNSSPSLEDILLINQIRNRTKMRLLGTEIVSGETLNHLLTFNIDTGTIAGENFYLTNSLIPDNWMSSENAWADLAALLIETKN